MHSLIKDDGEMKEAYKVMNMINYKIALQLLQGIPLPPQTCVSPFAADNTYVC